jgi:hypothetical protein
VRQGCYRWAIKTEGGVELETLYVQMAGSGGRWVSWVVRVKQREMWSWKHFRALLSVEAQRRGRAGQGNDIRCCRHVVGGMQL